MNERVVGNTTVYIFCLPEIQMLNPDIQHVGVWMWGNLEIIRLGRWGLHECDCCSYKR